MSGEIVVLYVYGILAGYIAGKTTQDRSNDNIAILIITIIAYLIIITSGYTSKSASIATWHTICSVSLSILSFICYKTLANEKPTIETCSLKRRQNMKVYQKLFEIMCLLKEMRTHCKSITVLNSVLEVQKKYFFAEAQEFSEEKKQIAWELMIESGDHYSSAKFLGLA